MRRIEWRLYKVGHCRQIEKLSCAAAPWRLCNFPALAGLITHPDHGHILFDAGYAPQFFDVTSRFPERAYRMMTPVTLAGGESLSDQLAADGIETADVGAVVVSHFHADHIAGVTDFPAARIFCAREGWEVMRSMGRWAGVRRGLLPALLPGDFGARATFFEELPVMSLPKGLAPFEAGFDLFGDGSLSAVPLPGHATGQFGLVFHGPDGQPVFLIADAAWSMQAVREFAQPMAIAGRLLHHSSAYPDTLRRLHELSRHNSELLIVPSHCRERQREFTQ